MNIKLLFRKYRFHSYTVDYDTPRINEWTKLQNLGKVGGNLPQTSQLWADDKKTNPEISGSSWLEGNLSKLEMMEHGDKFLMVFNPEEIFEYIYIYINARIHMTSPSKKKCIPKCWKKSTNLRNLSPPKKKKYNLRQPACQVTGLTSSLKRRPEVGLLLGKLHLHRCVLDPRETHLAKKVGGFGRCCGVAKTLLGCPGPEVIGSMVIGSMGYFIYLWLVNG